MSNSIVMVVGSVLHVDVGVTRNKISSERCYTAFLKCFLPGPGDVTETLWESTLVASFLG